MTIPVPCLLCSGDDQTLLRCVCALSFHLGSRGLEPQAWAQAVATAQLVFDMGTELGHHMHLLDVGGGFPGTEDTRALLEEVQTNTCPQQAENELGSSPRAWLPAEFPANQEEGSFFFPHRWLPG